jgi:hypothetical protein
MEEAWEALRRAMEVMEETAGGAGCVDAVEEAMQVAEKHVARSESLAALVAEARGVVEQARAAEAERVRVAAEAAEAAAAVEAAERLRLEEVAAEPTLRMQSDALMLQQVQAQLGSSVVPPAAPAPDEEDQCVMCFDAPKDHIIIPCGHVCVCEACANQLTQMRKPSYVPHASAAPLSSSPTRCSTRRASTVRISSIQSIDDSVCSGEGG